MSARKVRLLADLVRGKPVEEALAILQFMPQGGAEPLAKVVKSAAANAETNHSLEVETLRITTLYADGGRSFKHRIYDVKPRSRGRGDAIVRRTSHITVGVSADQTLRTGRNR
jgi:large subunit ribosomal protein L22